MTGNGPSDVDFYDVELRRHHVHLRAAADVRPGDHVLDIGCGLNHARRLAQAQGLRNIAFEHGDAQSHRLPTARFDLCISRFGMMFFTGPAAAVTNIASAMRPRLGLLLWQDADRNKWFPRSARHSPARPHPPRPDATWNRFPSPTPPTRSASSLLPASPMSASQRCTNPSPTTPTQTSPSPPCPA